MSKKAKVYDLKKSDYYNDAIAVAALCAALISLFAFISIESEMRTMSDVNLQVSIERLTVRVEGLEIKD